MADSVVRRSLSRRGAIAAGAAAVAGAGIWAARPSDRGGAHDAYFLALSKALRNAGLEHPVLVLDKRRLLDNIQRIRSWTNAAKMPLRVVAKSLPSPKLLETVLTGVGGDRMMLFSAQMAGQVLPVFPRAGGLMGKPLPAAEFARFVDRAGPAEAGRIAWLIDTSARLAEYGEVARAKAVRPPFSIEIDVGLHRGGLAAEADMAGLLEAAKAWPELQLHGLMGYDPHVVKMLRPDAAFAESQEAYRAFAGQLPAAGAGLVLNGAGSPTFRLHLAGSVANEVSVGSAFVKPSDFDLPALADLQPAAFIATPVLKSVGRTRLPGFDWLSDLRSAFDRNSARAYFIHGGHWLADPVSPPGLRNDSLFGRSSNQELLTGSASSMLAVGDHVFLRPRQSEALFLQFGDLAVYEDGAIVDSWPTLPISA